MSCWTSTIHTSGLLTSASCSADRFAEYSASQCGFCTPGFIVATHQALTKCQEKGEKPTQDVLQKGLDGNLCRCTGYRPILDACKVRRTLAFCKPLLYQLLVRLACPVLRSECLYCSCHVCYHLSCLASFERYSSLQSSLCATAPRPFISIA